VTVNPLRQRTSHKCGPEPGSLQLAQLSQRDRAAGCVSFGQKWKTGTGKQYFTDMSIFNHCDIISLQSYRIR